MTPIKENRPLNFFNSDGRQGKKNFWVAGIPLLENFLFYHSYTEAII